MKCGIVIFGCLLTLASVGQNRCNLTIRGDYTSSDSIAIVEAFDVAQDAVLRMKKGMDNIWNVPATTYEAREAKRKSRWESNPLFMKWLGSPVKMNSARKKIERIHAKFDKNITIQVIKQNKGRCTGWISAWTLPFGRVKIRLCEDYFIYRTHLQEKILIHEMGHEAGLLFHRRIHGCRAAKRAALSTFKHVAKKSTENYAWLAMGFMGLDCNH